MLRELRTEFIPIIVVAAVLSAALRYWWLGLEMPDNLEVLVTAVVMTYFAARSTGAAVTRALNGGQPATPVPPTGGTPDAA